MFAARFLCLCLLVFLSNRAALAQLPLMDARGSIVPTANAPAQDAPESGEDLEALRKDVDNELRIAQRTLDAATKASGEDASPPEQLQQDVELLKQLTAILAQQKTAAAQEEDLKTKLADLNGQLEAVRMSGPQESKPYSFLLLDRLKDELAARQARTEIGKAASDDSKQAVTRAKEELDKKEQTLRLLTSKLQAVGDEEEKTQLTASVKIAEDEKRVAEETVKLKKRQQAIGKLKQQIDTAQIDLLKEKVRWISKDVVFSSADLKSQEATLDNTESDLKKLLNTANTELDYFKKEWPRSRHQLDMATAPDPVLGCTSRSPVSRPTAVPTNSFPH